MPKFTIEVSAQLENVSQISTVEDYPWYIALRCGNCGEMTEKPVVISSSEEVDGIRGAVVNLKISCKLCGRVNDVKIIEEAVAYTDEQAPDWGKFLVLECRGTQPVDVTLASDVPLVITGREGFVFEDSFIEDGEFYGYDEKLNIEASVTEFQTRIVKG